MKNDNTANWQKIKIDSNVKPILSENAKKVLEKRYLIKDENGKTIETPTELFLRVAKFTASTDASYGISEEEIAKTALKFYEMMANLEFVPNSPTLMNAGRPLGQLSACFVLPVEDSIEGIFESIKNMALIHKSGGGTGFSFSHLRPRNDMVKSTTGVSSGPVPFMNIFNTATETVKQGGTRRGANMAMLSIDHPDIINFIKAKEDTSNLTNFNISVSITDKFMEALKNNTDFKLKNPRTGKTVKKINARETWDLIINKAWNNGEPGIVFIDRINAANPLKKVGLIESTNPCGEQPLLPYESCNLGSINLNKILHEESGTVTIDFEKLKDITRAAVHFLDNIIDANKYPLDMIDQMTKANRKIGLGIMGFADILISLKIPYNSNEAIDIAEKIMSAIQEESKIESRKLAQTRGAFPNFEKSEFAEKGEEPIRNATTTTIAPTGTISIIASASSGIEPLFALAYVRNVMDNDKLIETNPLFEETAKKHNFFSTKIMEEVAKHGTAADVEGIPEHIAKIFATSHDVAPEWHIKIQAAFQKYVDNAVSKTVNFPNSATLEDIEKVYTLAYELGCKGVTVYRDGSRELQVLSTGKTSSNLTAQVQSVVIEPRPRHEVTFGSTRKMSTGCGSLYVTINEDSKGMFEVFATMGKSGGCAASQAEAVSRLVSLALRSGIDHNQIVKQLKGVRCPNHAWEPGGKIYSCADAIAKAIERYTGRKPFLEIETVETQQIASKERAKSSAETNGKGNEAAMVGVCPDCHGPLEFESGCSTCRACGFSRCG